MTRKSIAVVFVLLGLVLLGWAFAPCFVLVRNGNALHDSQNNLHNIGLALASYHEVHGKLPPAVVFDKDGKPLYSWRVLLLPYLDEFLDESVKFNLSEAWDSPNNVKLLDKAGSCFWSSFSESTPGMTRYQVLIGPGTCFETPGLSLKTLRKDLPDNVGGPILVVEADQAVPWSKPADLAYDPKKPLPALSTFHSEPVEFLCRKVGRTPGFNALFSDGSVGFIPNKTDELEIRELITGNGGKNGDSSKAKK